MTYTEDIMRFLRLRVEALEKENERLNKMIENLEAKIEVTNTLNMQNTIYDNE